MHRIKRRFAGALMAIPVVAGSLVVGSTSAQAIVDGTAVAPASYPYLAQIDISKSSGTDGMVCDGTLISRYWVLTADHCAVTGMPTKNGQPNTKAGYTLDPAALTVTVGTQKPVGVSQVVRYPQFQALRTPGFDPGHPFPADFALLKLKKASSAPPLALAAKEPSEYHNLVVAGWGCTTVDKGKCPPGHSSTLYEATTTLFPDDSCSVLAATVPNSVWRLSDICTMRDTTPPGKVVQMSSTIRPGDSGGPVIERTQAGNRLVAVISGFSSDSSGVGYDVSGSIAYAASWITNVTGVSAPAMAPIAGDLNHDGSVNCADVSAMQHAMATTPPPLTADLNHDGKVDVFDLSILLSHWDPSLDPGC
jgi:secreted trypsin-like serine protease